MESGKLNEESLGIILLRKTDWHDYEGIKWLLERGVDPGEEDGVLVRVIRREVVADDPARRCEQRVDLAAAAVIGLDPLRRLHHGGIV